MAPPRIGCLDLDTFFVSVERLLDPELVGRPVIVGARPGHRGVVVSASYEVRPLGVRAGMPIARAHELAPHAVFVPPRHGVYGGWSARVRAILEACCPVVQTASIDEFYLDFRGCERLFRRPGDADDDAAVAREVRAIRERIQEELGLPSSIGLAPTRPLAKMASGRAKPAGVLVVDEGGELAFARPLPVRRWPGIGPVAEQRLTEAGVLTLGDLLDLPPGPERARFEGLRQGVLQGLARTPTPGRDRPAFREHDPRGLAEGSISNERTFHADVGDHRVVEAQLLALSERVAWRARQRGVLARTITLKLRHADFHTVTRSRTIPATSADAAIHACVVALFRAVPDRGKAVRLVGVGLSNLERAPAQLALPLGDPTPAPSQALDAVRDRFGYDAIRLGRVDPRSSWVA